MGQIMDDINLFILFISFQVIVEPASEAAKPCG